MDRLETEAQEQSERAARAARVAHQRAALSTRVLYAQIAGNQDRAVKAVGAREEEGLDHDEQECGECRASPLRESV